MTKDLFVNATILISFVSIIYQVFRNNGLSRKSSIKHRILSGTIWGLMGIPLIIFGVNVTPTIIIDFRNIALILSAFFGGFASVAVTGIIIGLFRILHTGVTSSSIAANLVLLGIIIGTGFLSNLKIPSWKKWFGMVLYSLILSSVAFFLLIQDSGMRLKVITTYSISTGIVGALVYYYVELLSSYGKMTLKWKNEAIKDFLTGLYNVREFDRVFNDLTRWAREQGEPLSLLLIDIDYFKKINDNYGHSEGDHVLRDLGALLWSTCRGTDKIFRIGGEEMAILLPDCDLLKALEVAERVRLAVMTSPFQTNHGDQFRVTVSIGVATYAEPVSNTEALKESADNALYKAKHDGRNQVQHV